MTTDKAAQLLASASTPGDAPTEVTKDIDLNFLSYDPSDARPHMLKAGWNVAAHDTFVAANALRWVNFAPTQLDRRRYEGWELTDPLVRRGDLVLCSMPKARANAIRAHFHKVALQRRLGAFAKFDEEASKVAQQYPGHFSPFDGDATPNAGLR